MGSKIICTGSRLRDAHGSSRMTIRDRKKLITFDGDALRLRRRIRAERASLRTLINEQFARSSKRKGVSRLACAKTDITITMLLCSDDWVEPRERS